MRTLLAACLLAASLVGVTACGSSPHYVDIQKLANEPVKAQYDFASVCADWSLSLDQMPNARTAPEAAAMWFLTQKIEADKMHPSNSRERALQWSLHRVAQTSDDSYGRIQAAAADVTAICANP